MMNISEVDIAKRNGVNFSGKKDVTEALKKKKKMNDERGDEDVNRLS